MSGALADFHFLRPLWLIALAGLPLLAFAWRRARTASVAWRGVVDAHLLPHLVDRDAVTRGSRGAWIAVAVWTVTTFALAGPAWEREALPLYRNEAARVIAIELAPTMLAADLKPNRLARARFKINDILRASRDMQTALIGYAGDAYVAAPLTDDVNTVANLVDALDPSVMPVAGNAAETAIREAVKLVEQAGRKQGELILLADGASSAAIDAAREAHARGLVVSVLGVGTPAGAPVALPQGGFLQDGAGNIVVPRLDEGSLRSLAEAGGGRYATLSTDRVDLDLVLGAGVDASSTAHEGDAGDATSERFRDRGPWLVLALLPLALLAFRRGWLMAFSLVLVLPAGRAHAFSFADLWLRPDQQAARALAEGDAQRARELARDPALQGGAAYRAGDFKGAEEAYTRAAGAEADYNRGNALARQGDYEGALKAYAKAVEAQPGHEDARANEQALREWLEKQDAQSPDQQGDNSDESGKGKNDPSKGGEGERKPSDEQQPNEGASAQEGEQGDKDERRSEQKKPEQGDDEATGKDAQGDASQESEAQAREKQREGQQQLSQAIDEAIKDAPPEKDAAQVAADPEQEAAREQDQALNQWLQRVPDDPGGLLRRKFLLEHERRQRGGGGR
ncbi:VWA domain-containing protein [Dokdonella sp. MW10]|uniref:VWA domain-containing protein n=1 Tax=Dokdonella sp. MW10 TaxID=2992926 RepID=UPI003F7F5596